MLCVSPIGWQSCQRFGRTGCNEHNEKYDAITFVDETNEIGGGLRRRVCTWQ